MNIEIRQEETKDHREVEELTREAFWNFHVPGCDEHYLVHKIRTSDVYIPELNFVAVMDDKIVGSIIYTKSYILDEEDKKQEVLTFGPLCVHPDFQRKGIGKALMAHSMEKAKEMGYSAIVIYGSPGNYCSSGFKSSKNYGIMAPNGVYPYALLAIELYPNALENATGKFYTSDAFEMNPADVEEFDKQFPHKEKGYAYTQEEFAIACRAVLI